VLRCHGRALLAVVSPCASFSNLENARTRDALASRKHDKQAQFYAFDMLAGDREDYRPQSLVLRKANLARLLKRRG
jgi:ATP-dependent DNA ligase